MKEYLNGLHFYDIKIVTMSLLGSHNYRICTYRQIGEIEKVFNERKTRGDIYRYEPAEIDHDTIIDEENYFFPMYCVELNKVYSQMNELVEDIIIGKLSGLLDVDVNFGIGEDNG